jgi:ubiquitin-like 1-activating enzyme E1 A
LCTSEIIIDFIKQLEPTDLSGVAAVLGGLLSQDVLNALGGREIPVKNWLIFDGRSCISPSSTQLIQGEGKIYNLMGETKNGTAS